MQFSNCGKKKQSISLNDTNSCLIVLFQIIADTKPPAIINREFNTESKQGIYFSNDFWIFFKDTGYLDLLARVL